MSEENKNIARRVMEEVWNYQKLSVVDELFSPDYEMHDPATPLRVRGTGGFKQFHELYSSAFPDQHFTIDDLITDRDRVVIRWTVKGTHKGELLGIAPTGKSVSVTGTTISRIAGGKIVEDWVHWDPLGLLRQIGAVARNLAGGRIGKRSGTSAVRERTKSVAMGHDAVPEFLGCVVARRLLRCCEPSAKSALPMRETSISA